MLKEKFEIENLLKKKHNKNNLYFLKDLKSNNINEVLILTEISIKKIQKLLKEKEYKEFDSIIIK